MPVLQGGQPHFQQQQMPQYDGNGTVSGMPVVFGEASAVAPQPIVDKKLDEWEGIANILKKKKKTMTKHSHEIDQVG